ncbi:flavin prenyltransferase UbiX [Marinospirillum sp. MEB164]|uniref:Flavin prenyltransferase UbiX n=1 Tax=Marinospirillum alkalitolerans TaxID=3123374 RepID=A0ABW8PXS5_9GAMM
MKRVTLALTGASGIQYGLRLLDCLVAQGCQVDLLVSKAAHLVMATETPVRWPSDPERLNAQLAERYADQPGQVRAYGRENWFAPAASGSGAAASMVVCPCSGGTLSALATGASNNLIERAGDVALKERRQLILVLREMPLHQVHLEHMLKLTQMGAVIMPASPGFYHDPQTIDDLVDFVVARVLDQLGLEQQLVARWGEEPAG